MLVVLGATGHTGSVVAQTLFAHKQPVRVVVRSADQVANWVAKGAEAAVASLDDQAALTKALQGASGVYLLIPPNYGATAWLAEQRRRVDQMADCACGGVVVDWRAPSGRNRADTRGSVWRTTAHWRGAECHDPEARVLYR